MPTPQDKGFDPSLFECIDRALKATIGGDAVATFYYYTREIHGIPQNEFPKRPFEVLQHLKDMFGETGYQVLEKPIIAQIKETFQIRENVINLTDILNLAKRNYLQNSV